MNTWRELVEAHEEIKVDREAAAAILLQLKVNRQAAIVLLPIVTEAVGAERRRLVAQKEQVAFSGRAKGKDIRELLVEETFAVGNGRRVAWLDATVDDHEERIVYQQKLIGSIATDIDRHKLAIKLIRNAGVTCLRELPQEDAA